MDAPAPKSNADSDNGGAKRRRKRPVEETTVDNNSGRQHGRRAMGSSRELRDGDDRSDKRCMFMGKNNNEHWVRVYSFSVSIKLIKNRKNHLS